MNVCCRIASRAIGALITITLSVSFVVPDAAASGPGADSLSVRYATDENWASPPLTDLLALSTAFESQGYWSFETSRRGRIEALGIDLLLVKADAGPKRERFSKLIAVKFGLKPVHAKGATGSQISDYGFALSAGRVIHGTTNGGVPFAAYIAHHSKAEFDTAHSLLTGRTELSARSPRQWPTHAAWLRILRGAIAPALASEACSGLAAPSPFTDLADCEKSISSMALARTAGTCAVDALKKMPGEALAFFDGLLTDPKAYWNAAVDRIDRLGQALMNLDIQIQPILQAFKGLSLEAKEEIVCAVAADLAPKVARLGTGVGAASAAIMIAESLAKLSRVSKILEGLSRAASSGAAQVLIRGAIACEAN